MQAPLVYYISSHGYGHAVRSCEVIRNLPADLPLMIRTAVPESFLREELGSRAFAYVHVEYDCGVLGPDSSHADLAATFTRAEELQHQNEARLAAEVEVLKTAGTRVVVADIVPFALRAAHSAGLPSVLIANFTWPAIYTDLLRHFELSPDLEALAARVIAGLQADFDLGTVMLETEFAIQMQACQRRERVGLISRRGTNQRAALVAALKLDPLKSVYLIYLGREGLSDVHWDRLPALDGQFVAYSVPPGAEPWVHELPRHALHHADAAASVDAVIAKPGYGLCAECMACGTPLLYIPRPHFCESDAIAKVLSRWGGALQLDLELFRALEWGPALKQLSLLRPNSKIMDIAGGRECAIQIMQFL